jgi:hypothetical protein
MENDGFEDVLLEIFARSSEESNFLFSDQLQPQNSQVGPFIATMEQMALATAIEVGDHGTLPSATTLAIPTLRPLSDTDLVVPLEEALGCRLSVVQTPSSSFLRGVQQYLRPLSLKILCPMAEITPRQTLGIRMPNEDEKGASGACGRNSIEFLFGSTWSLAPNQRRFV